MSLFDRYGIKEVADVTFYAIEDGKIGKPVLFLDTLKVSTVESTAETTEAKGGKGNTALIAWDYGKEITVNLEDALFSKKSWEVMYDAKFKNTAEKSIIRTNYIRTSQDKVCWRRAHSQLWQFVASAIPGVIIKDDAVVGLTIGGKDLLGDVFLVDSNGTKIPLTDFPTSTGSDTILSLSKDLYTDEDYANFYLKAGTYFAEIALDVDGMEIDVSANAFPGTYYVTADTFIRNETSGKDELFQLVFPKVKVLSESNTITMEAEGDPSVFNMSLKVLKNKNTAMMQLIKYVAGNYSRRRTYSDSIQVTPDFLKSGNSVIETAPVTIAEGVSTTSSQTYDLRSIATKAPIIATYNNVPKTSPLLKDSLILPFRFGLNAYDLGDGDGTVAKEHFASGLDNNNVSTGVATACSSSSTYVVGVEPTAKNDQDSVTMLTVQQWNTILDAFEELAMFFINVEASLTLQEDLPEGIAFEAFLSPHDSYDNGEYHIWFRLWVTEDGKLLCSGLFDHNWLFTTSKGLAWLASRAVGIGLSALGGKLGSKLLDLDNWFTNIGFKTVTSFGYTTIENLLQQGFENLLDNFEVLQ